MNFIEELTWRGLLKNKSEGLEEALQKGPIKAYIGYDPTAPSLTIGNLVTMMLLKHLQLHGHQPIVLMGGATGKIGDPSGKDAERQLLSYDVINSNIARFKSNFATTWILKETMQPLCSTMPIFMTAWMSLLF